MAPSWKICIAAALAAAVAAGEAGAASKGLLFLGGLDQSLELNYLFDGISSKEPGRGTATSSRHYFGESYHAGLDYALLSPRILRGKVKLGFKLNQERFTDSYDRTDSGNRRNFLYDVGATLFDRKPYPITIFSRSETNHVQRPFVKGYDIDADSYGFGISLLNSYLPVQVSYQSTTSESKGEAIDRRLTTSLLSIVARNTIGASSTDLHLTRSGYTSDTVERTSGGHSESVIYALGLKNRTFFNKQRTSLLSTLNYRDEENRGMHHTLSLSEGLSFELGKALSMDLLYDGVRTKDQDGQDGNWTEYRSDAGMLILHHKLFDSLTTRYTLRGRKADQSVGWEKEYSGALDLSYQKKLPANSILQATFLESHAVTSRQFTTPSQPVVDEALTVDLLGINQLRYPNVYLETVVVRDADNPTILYNLNADYQLTAVGNLTGFDFAIPGSRIGTGTRLLISYSYAVDADTRYGTISRQGSANLLLQGGRYQVSAAIAQTDHSTKSNGSVVLADTLFYQMGGSWTRDGMHASLMYSANDSNDNSYSSLEGTFRRYFLLGPSTISLQLRDRYTSYESTGYNRAGRKENIFTGNVDLTRNLFRNGAITARVLYIKLSGAGSVARDDLTLEAIYRWGYGKLSLEAGAKTQFRFSNGYTLRDDNVSLRILRTF